MSDNKTLNEASEAQKKALEIFLEVDDDYRAPSFVFIAQKLKELGYKASQSSVQRWSKEFGFEFYLQNHVNSLMLADKEKAQNMQTAAGEENLKRTLMTLEENAELLHGSHKILKLAIEEINAKYDKTNKISKDDVKIMLQLYKVTSEREDRLHDRQAGLEAIDKIGKNDLLKVLAQTGVDIEELQAEAIDVDIEVE